MTKSSVHRPSLSEQLELYKNVLIWDTRLSNKLNDHRAIEESEIERTNVDEFRRELRGSLLCTENSAQQSLSSRSVENENYTLIEDTKELSTVWNYFGRHTTFHGVRNIVSKDRRIHSRLLWLLLVCGMAVGTLYTVAVLLMEYYQYNTITKSDVKISQSAMFPSVTICNMCPFKNIYGTTDSALFRLLASRTLFLHDSLPVNFSNPETEDLLQWDIIETQEKLTFTMDELFFNAQFENVVLNISEAFENLETIFGRCFTFNGPEYISKYGPRLVKSDGRTSGLSMYVQLNQDKYFAFEDLTAGVRVFVAHHPETPRIRQDGIDIHPGTSSKLALNPVMYTFLPAPYKSYGEETCEDTNNKDFRHKMVNASFYSYDNCIEQCHTYKASIMCSCYTHLLYVSNLRRCLMRDVAFCFIPKRENMTAAECDCPRPCTFTRYDATMSASQIPSKVTAELLRKQLNVSSTAELRYHYLLPSNDALGEDYLEIRVFLETMLVRHEMHESQYTFSSVFAFLGGQMGFFIGASLITLAELLETIIFSGYIFFHTKIMKMGQLTTTTTRATTITPTTNTQIRQEKNNIGQ